MLCWQIKCQFFIENLMHQYIFSLKIDIIIMCCLNFKTWIWSPFPLYSIFLDFYLFDCENNINLLQSNFLFFEFGVHFFYILFLVLSFMIVKITLISFRAIFFSNLIYDVALINLTLRMIISKCILTSIMYLNLLNIKSLKKKFNMQKIFSWKCKT